jgi:aspartate aminotransferase-like enzyme
MIRCQKWKGNERKRAYSRNDKGYVIYPGQVSEADCFRIGIIGRIFPSDVRDLLAAIGETLVEMKIESGKLIVGS